MADVTGQGRRLECSYCVIALGFPYLFHIGLVDKQNSIIYQFV